MWPKVKGIDRLVILNDQRNIIKFCHFSVDFDNTTVLLNSEALITIFCGYLPLYH